MNELSRRNFMYASSASALSYSRILGANDRVRMGYIGVGNRGDQVHDAFLEWADQETVAVCDLRDDYMNLAVRKSPANPRKFRDYRKLLEAPDVDAVVIAAPDWTLIQISGYGSRRVAPSTTPSRNGSNIRRAAITSRGCGRLDHARARACGRHPARQTRPHPTHAVLLHRGAARG